MAAATTWEHGADLDQATLTDALEASRTPVLVNGWWRDWNGGPVWWDVYTTGGGAVAEDTTTWQTCGRSLKLSGGTAEVYQDVYGLLQEGWRGLDVVLLADAWRDTANWELLVDWGAGGTSTVLQGSATDEWETRAIKLTVPASADQFLVVLRWTSASGYVLFDRVQLTVGAAQVGWLGEALEPLVLCEGVLDANGATFTEYPDARMAVVPMNHTGLSGSASQTDTEDWTVAADYWPTGWARIDAGSNGDRWTTHPSWLADEASNNFRLGVQPVGAHGTLDGKPQVTVACAQGATFGSGDLDTAMLVFLHQHGPDPATRVAYPGGV